MSIAKTCLLASLGALLVTPALAQHRPYPTSPYNHSNYSEANTNYGIIARQTEIEQNAPGVTTELAPDAKETATGGPVGGVPGFSGGH